MVSLLSCVGATKLHKSKKATGLGSAARKTAMHEEKGTSRLPNRGGRRHDDHGTSEAAVASERSATSSMGVEEPVVEEKKGERVRDSFDPRLWTSMSFKEVTGEEQKKTGADVMDGYDNRLWKKNQWLFETRGMRSSQLAERHSDETQFSY